MKTLAANAAGLLNSPRARRWLQILAVTLVLVFFGLALVSQLPKILAYDWVFDPVYLALAFVLLLLRGPVVVLGWWYTVRLLGYKLPFLKAIRIGYHSALARYIPGQMWYAVSRVVLAEKEGVPRMITAISVGLETALLVAAAGLVSSLSLFVWPRAPLWLAVVVIVIILVLVTQPRLMFSVMNKGLVRMGRKPVDASLSRKDMVKLLAPFTLNWLEYGIMSFALTASLYPSLSWSQLPGVIGLFTAAWLIGFLIVFIPQGAVVREGLVFTFLTTLVGVPAPVATAVALLSRGWSMLGEAIWASVSTRF